MLYEDGVAFVERARREVKEWGVNVWSEKR
jgi:hypothetical protein